jgi:hypothetical protein
MTTITWKNSDTKGKRIVFEIGNQVLGTLTLLNELSLNAKFNAANEKFQFKQPSFLDNKINLMKNNLFIGQIKIKLFSKSCLNLKSGKTYFLSSNGIGRNLKWIDSDGVSIVEYSMATLKSKGKGSIKIKNLLTKEDQELLISAGLIAGRLKGYRLGILIFLLAFSLATIIKLI